MKQTFYLLIIVFLFTACNLNGSINNNLKVISGITFSSGFLNSEKIDTAKKLIVSDSLVIFDDSLFADLELIFIEISKNEFQSYKQKYKVECVIDSGQFIRGSGLYVSRNCDEICETYLVERTTHRKMLMPSNYDAGIINMLLSTTCKQLIICSSYDGPDFGDYYEYRAEIFLFSVCKKTPTSFRQRSDKLLYLQRI